MDYETKALEAFINSDSAEWYAEAFKKFSQVEHRYPVWKWSWWAFFGGIWFLFYRKLYLEGFAFWMIGIIITFLFGPWSMLPLMVCLGGFAPWILYRRYSKIKREVEYTTSDKKERLFLMEDLGGCNKWIIPLLIGLLILMYLF